MTGKGGEEGKRSSRNRILDPSTLLFFTHTHTQKGTYYLYVNACRVNRFSDSVSSLAVVTRRSYRRERKKERGEEEGRDEKGRRWVLLIMLDDLFSHGVNTHVLPHSHMLTDNLAGTENSYT